MIFRRSLALLNKYMKAKYDEALWLMNQSLKIGHLYLQTQSDSIEKQKTKF